MNLVKDLNMKNEHVREYAELIRKANPMFIEIKGFMSVGFARERLGYDKMPYHEDIVEFDELWSFVGSKAYRVWVWIALCRRTKQVVAYHLGDRKKKDFENFYLKVPIDYANCRSTSDGFEV